MAFCTAELKKASLKKSREPLKMTRALFRACSPAMRRVFFPTACGYWSNKRPSARRAETHPAGALTPAHPFLLPLPRGLSCLLLTFR